MKSFFSVLSSAIIFSVNFTSVVDSMQKRGRGVDESHQERCARLLEDFSYASEEVYQEKVREFFSRVDFMSDGDRRGGFRPYIEDEMAKRIKSADTIIGSDGSDINIEKEIKVAMYPLDSFYVLAWVDRHLSTNCLSRAAYFFALILEEIIFSLQSRYDKKDLKIIKIIESRKLAETILAMLDEFVPEIEPE